MRIQLSGCAIISNNEELLLLWKIKHQHYEFPGGKVENGESLEECAKRECYEELGIDVIISKYIEYENFDIDGKSFQSHKFLGIIENNQTPIINEPEKFSKLFWLPIRQYQNYSCAPNVKAFCQKYIDGKLLLD
jgi:8-oxo-dGTP diphosphatase